MLALAGLLVFAPSNSHAQGSDPYGEMIELELDGYFGDGINYALSVGVRPKYTPYSFNCGFTVEYYLGIGYDVKLSGKTHCGRASTYLESFLGPCPKYYFPTEEGLAFLRLIEKHPGEKATGLNFLHVIFTPDDPTEIWNFRRILLRPEPFLERLDDVTELGSPIGVHPSNWNVVKDPKF